jgi:hypothetical protein
MSPLHDADFRDACRMLADVKVFWGARGRLIS